MRQRNSSLPVQQDEHGTPIAVLIDEGFQQVTVIDSWQWAGDWVTGVSERHYWLVALEEGGVLELYRESDTDLWVVAATQD